MMQSEMVQQVAAGGVREYRLNKVSKFLCFFMAAMFLCVGALFFGVSFWVRGSFGSALLVPAVGVLFGAIVLCVSAVRARILLSAGSIAVTSIFQTRELAFDQIRGRREYSTRGGTCLVLVPKEPHVKSISVAPNFALDEAWNTWFRALPDLDAIDKQEKLAEIAADSVLGSTPEERLAKLGQARKAAAALAVTAVVAAVLAFFELARPVAAVLLTVLPWAAIYLLYQSPMLYRVGGVKSDPRMGLDLPVWIPCFGLAITATAGAHHVSMGPALWLICLSGIALAAALVRPMLHSGRGFGILIASLALSIGYGVGLGFAANRFLDYAPAQAYRAEIASMSTSTGRHGTTYYLHLNPWGPMTEEDKVDVSSSLYRSLKEGDTVCLELHPGALKMGWYTVEACP
jgi:hypothetical protein